jgi:antibiotic biosynthesis monooxygenase (ABM) superfamily enzyme
MGAVFVMVISYRARAGEQDAIVALHENWRLMVGTDLPGCLGGELVCSKNDPLAFATIARFTDEAAAHALAFNPAHRSWFHRAASMCEVAPVIFSGTTAWSS